MISIRNTRANPITPAIRVLDSDASPYVASTVREDS